MYRAIHVRDGAQLVELTRVACKLKLTFAPLVVMIRQVHGAFPASTNSTPTWVSENNPSIDGGRVSTTCGRNPGFQAERGFLVRLILVIDLTFSQFRVGDCGLRSLTSTTLSQSGSTQIRLWYIQNMMQRNCVVLEQWQIQNMMQESARRPHSAEGGDAARAQR